MFALSNELRELIGSSIDSVEALEIILLLLRSPQTYWAPLAIAEQLGIGVDVAMAKMEAFHRRGILKLGGTTVAYRYGPADKSLAGSIEDLARAFSEHPVSIINAIDSLRLERLRAFPDEFRVK